MIKVEFSPGHVAEFPDDYSEDQILSAIGEYQNSQEQQQPQPQKKPEGLMLNGGMVPPPEKAFSPYQRADIASMMAGYGKFSPPSALGFTHARPLPPEAQVSGTLKAPDKPLPERTKGQWIEGKYYPSQAEIDSGMKVPEQETGFLSQFKKSMTQPEKNAAVAALIATGDDETLKAIIESEYRLQQEAGAAEPMGLLGQFGLGLGSLGGGLKQWVVGQVVPGKIGPALVFGATGYGEEFVRAALRARSEGKSTEDALKIGKAAAPIGAVSSGGQALILPPAQTLGSTPLRTAGKESGVQGLAGGLGQLGVNLYEQQLGLQTPTFEGVPTATAFGAALPMAGYATMKGLGALGQKLLTPTKGKTDASKIATAKKADVGAPPGDSQTMGEGVPESGQAAEVRTVALQKEGQVEPTTGQPIPEVPGMSPEKVAKGMRIEGEDHPTIPKDKLSTLVDDEWKVTKTDPYKNDVDPLTGTKEPAPIEPKKTGDLLSPAEKPEIPITPLEKSRRLESGDLDTAIAHAKSINAPQSLIDYLTDIKSVIALNEKIKSIEDNYAQKLSDAKKKDFAERKFGYHANADLVLDAIKRETQKYWDLIGDVKAKHSGEEGLGIPTNVEDLWHSVSQIPEKGPLFANELTSKLKNPIEYISPASDLAKKAEERLKEIGVGKGVSIEEIQQQQAIKSLIDTGKTAHEALKALVEGEHFSGLTQELAGWLVKLGDMGIKKETGGEYYSEKFKTKAAGRYNPDTDTVHVYDVGFNNLKGANTYLHEYVHALTHKAIDSGKHVVVLTRIFNQALKKAQDAGIEFHALSTDVEGGVTKANLHEFVSEVMSNEKFQQFLKNQTSPLGGKFRSMWDDFVNYVANMFGIQKTSSLYDSLKLSMDLAYARKVEMEAGRPGTAKGGVPEMLAPAESQKEAKFAGYMLGEVPQVNIPGVRPGIQRTVSLEEAKRLGYTLPEIPTKEQWKSQQADVNSANLSEGLREKLQARMASMKAQPPNADWSLATTEPSMKAVGIVPEGTAEIGEAAQRAANALKAVSEGKHPGGPPEMIVDGSKPPGNQININRRKGDYGLIDIIKSPQFLFYFGKFGEMAKKAWETMALGEFGMRESIARDVQKYVTNLRASLPKPFRKQSGKAFMDMLDGKTIQEIEQQYPDQPKVVEAARGLKDRLEIIRQDIRDTKRNGYAEYLDTLNQEQLSELYRDNIGPDIPQGINKSGLVNALADAEYPANWGISDGSYLPHLFFGSWKVTMKDPNGTVSFVTRAKTPQEAKIKIKEAVKSNPLLADAEFNVEQDMAIPPDMLRLFDKRFFKMVNDMKNNLGVSAEEIRQAQRGIIGRKASKQKWFGSLQERLGFTGYSKDFDKVLTAYLSGYHRWKSLTALQREVMPMIEQVKADYPFAAGRLEGLMENLWGKPSRVSKLFDNTLQKIPVVRDYVQPMMLDTIARGLRSAAVFGHLRTVRYAVLNRLQPLQGLYPIIGEATLAKAKMLQHSDAGKQLLDEFGVRFDAGQFSEPGFRGRLTNLRERITGEKSNQELAFLGMYLHGKNQGMSHAEAGKYGKLRGQLMTQFTPLVVDTPELFEGPVGQTLFQYKRFPVKQIELMTTMARDKNLPAGARLLMTFALTGGASYFLRQAFTSPTTRTQVYNYLEDQLGEDGAKVAFYGLPGYLGADISGSLVMGEELAKPQLFGPAVSTAAQIARDIAKPEREDITATEKAKAIARKIPALKQIVSAIDLMTGDTDVLTPDGEVAYRRSLSDMLLGMGAFRSANESNARMAVDTIVELSKKEAELKNEYYVAKQRGDTSAVEDKIDKFNNAWPEVKITQRQLNAYADYRKRGKGKTEPEKIAKGKYKKLLR